MSGDPDGRREASWCIIGEVAADPEVLRTQMVDLLMARGVLTSPAVEAAMRSVARHRFLPETSPRLAYADDAVMVKYALSGQPLSSASQPTMVAIMLELLGVEAGQRILEIGTGTGYNACLLATLTGVQGRVVSVELEPDLAEMARRALTEAGVPNVTVVAGDGREGYPALAPYDRVIVTTGADRISPAWTDQLDPAGRLVLPLVDRTGVGTLVVCEWVQGRLSRRQSTPCAFLPIRGET